MWKKFRRSSFARSSNSGRNSEVIASTSRQTSYFVEGRRKERNDTACAQLDRRNIYLGRRSRRQARPRETWQQWRSLRMEQLVANEIESIINDDQHMDESSSQEDSPRRLARRLSFSSLRRGSISFRDASAATSSSSSVSSMPSITSSSRRRRLRTRPHVRDSTINRYTLFGENNPSKPSKQQSSDAAVIYEKDYPIAFTPLVTFLGVTFLGLLVLRIVIALLTVAMGFLIVLVAAGSLLDFLRNPFYKAQRLLSATHQSPMLVLGAAGALSGTCVALWVHGQTDEMSLMLALLEGMVYGIEAGAVWLAVFGSGADQSTAALWILRTWRKLCGEVEEIQVWWDDSSSASNENGRKCMICLETFQHDERKQILSCLHGFHQHCVDQWLCRKPTCPICRVPTSLRSDTQSEGINQ